MYAISLSNPLPITKNALGQYSQGLTKQTIASSSYSLNPTLLLATWVSLGKLANISELQIPPL